MLMPTEGFPSPHYEIPAGVIAFDVLRQELAIALSIHAEPPSFEPFAKIPRLARESCVTEKIDGSNAQILITPDRKIFAGSRSRWIRPGKTTDNFGFAAWVEENEDELQDLGIGKHFGEWWGPGIQCGYGRDQRKFSLFNASRWRPRAEVRVLSAVEESFLYPKACFAPACCDVVPVMYRGLFSTVEIEACVESLRTNGSWAQPGFGKPEGVIVYHSASGTTWKRLLLNDEGHKGPAGTLH